MNLVSIAPRGHSTEKTLEVLDQLRQKIVDGEIVAFAAAALNAEDESYVFAAASKGVSRLRLQGAIAQLLHSYLAGD